MDAQIKMQLKAATLDLAARTYGSTLDAGAVIVAAKLFFDYLMKQEGETNE